VRLLVVLDAVVALAAVGGRVTLGEMTFDMMAFRQGQQSFQALLAALSGMYEDNLCIDG
jgi:ATP-binding cassette, subfamily B, bacterial